MLFISAIRTQILPLIAALLFVQHATSSPSIEKRASRTSPPSGAIVVKPSGASSGQFNSIQAAVNSLPNDSSSQTIFIYPGKFVQSRDYRSHF